MGAGRLARRLLRRAAPGRRDHDLLDDDARLGVALPLDAGLDSVLRRPGGLGDRRGRRGDRLADPDQLPLSQHGLGRRPFPHLSDDDRRPLGSRIRRALARARNRPDVFSRRPALGDDRPAARRRLRADRHLVRRRRARRSSPIRSATGRHGRLQLGRSDLRASVRARLPRLHRAARPARPYRLGPTALDVSGGEPGPGRRLRCRAGRGRQPQVDERSPARAGAPLGTAAHLGFAVAFVVVAIVAFFPGIVDASETSTRYHHLDHAGQFLFGVVVGLLLGSFGAVSRALGDLIRPGGSRL